MPAPGDPHRGVIALRRLSGWAYGFAPGNLLMARLAALGRTLEGTLGAMLGWVVAV